MKVPAPVKRVLDTFPLVTLPPCTELPQQHGTYIHTYGLYKGLPADPQCLAFAGLVTLMSEAKLIQSSPYISSQNKLPLVQFDSGSVITSIDELMRILFTATDEEEDNYEYSTAEINAFKTLVETWLNDAWYATILKPQQTAIRRLIYQSPSDEQIPFPFKLLVNSQLDDLLYSSTHQCATLRKASLAFQTFEQMLQDGKGFHIGPELGSHGIHVLDILVFAYTWPIIELIPESDLADLVGPLLREHASQVEGIIREKLASACC